MKTFTMALLSAVSIAAAASPESDLATENPKLAQLTKDYASYVKPMMEYARMQGFTAPYEQYITMIHELSHISSASHQGYFMDGVYYEPYVAPEYWPTLRNKDVAPLMLPDEKGPIYSIYMPSTPANNLGNILDEVNAYTHGMTFICKHEPQSAKRQAANLIGHLNVIEAYLRTARTRLPAEYKTLIENRLSAGALTTITQRAWAALSACGLPQGTLGSGEATNFIRAFETSVRRP